MFPEVAEMSANGLLERCQGRVQLTRRGLMIADSVFAAFL
jgi:coproporphyrinogen III oxidase-like Fe-S oxidoreductase